MSRSSVISGLLAGATIALAFAASRTASAEPPPPVDVVLREGPPVHRTFTIEWNPLALFIERLSANVVIAPVDHHALVLSPFYTWASTIPYATAIDAEGNPLPATLNVLKQSFKGFGGELGYRYYLQKGGARGFFVGPSVLLAGITATAGDGSQTSFLDFGVAADVGYEALVADKIAVTVGGGLQYTFTDKSIPPQQLPASVYANDALRPRFLLAIGYAL
jgi:hypothetical protein